MPDISRRPAPPRSGPGHKPTHAPQQINDVRGSKVNRVGNDNAPTLIETIQQATPYLNLKFLYGSKRCLLVAFVAPLLLFVGAEEGAPSPLNCPCLIPLFLT